jgi:hypothetical protein
MNRYIRLCLSPFLLVEGLLVLGVTAAPTQLTWRDPRQEPFPWDSEFAPPPAGYRGR